MNRVSKRLSPKTKVVDLLFLYNFYFGQISSSNINYFFEFWIVKFGSKSFKCVHCAPLTTGPACHLLVSSRTSRIVSVLKSSTAPLLLSLSPSPLSLTREHRLLALLLLPALLPRRRARARGHEPACPAPSPLASPMHATSRVRPSHAVAAMAVVAASRTRRVPLRPARPAFQRRAMAAASYRRHPP